MKILSTAVMQLWSQEELQGAITSTAASNLALLAIWIQVLFFSQGQGQARGWQVKL
jgi:hypothetical protein